MTAKFVRLTRVNGSDFMANPNQISWFEKASKGVITVYFGTIAIDVTIEAHIDELNAFENRIAVR